MSLLKEVEFNLDDASTNLGNEVLSLQKSVEDKKKWLDDLESMKDAEGDSLKDGIVAEKEFCFLFEHISKESESKNAKAFAAFIRARIELETPEEEENADGEEKS